MTNSKSTKRALLLSALSILMCVAMLVGTTFAWFTDTASTAVNKIQAGTLDVVLEMADGFNDDGSTKWVDAEGKVLNFVKAEGGADQRILWEPGCTYELPALRIRNKGNLALKFKVVITGIAGDAELDEVIDWKINFPTAYGISDQWYKLNEGTGATLSNASGNDDFCNLIPGANTEFHIKGHMQESAGNEYQGKSINGIAITVFATQTPYEFDSTEKFYDEDAQFPDVENKTVAADDVATNGATVAGTGRDTTVTTVNALKVAKDNITIKDMTIKGTGASGNDGTLNISGKNATVENVNYFGQGTGGDSAITVSTGAGNDGVTFKNTTISNAFRGIQFWHLSGENNLIENCVLDIAGYPFHVDNKDPGAKLTVKDSTLNGWTSYTSGIELVKFENTKFGKNTYEFLRPYSETQLVNCEFTTEGFELNAGGSDAYTITLTNCTKNGTAITADNVQSLLLDMVGWNHNATLVVNGTTVTLH